MGAKAKIVIMVLLLIIVIIAVWQFASPARLPPVGNKYTTHNLHQHAR